jgi:hypothetical protein
LPVDIPTPGKSSVGTGSGLCDGEGDGEGAADADATGAVGEGPVADAHAANKTSIAAAATIRGSVALRVATGVRVMWFSRGSTPV